MPLQEEEPIWFYPSLKKIVLDKAKEAKISFSSLGQVSASNVESDTEIGVASLWIGLISDLVVIYRNLIFSSPLLFKCIMNISPYYNFNLQLKNNHTDVAQYLNSQKWAWV